LEPLATATDEASVPATLRTPGTSIFFLTASVSGLISQTCCGSGTATSNPSAETASPEHLRSMSCCFSTFNSGNEMR
jgi:hypothetical protein